MHERILSFGLICGFGFLLVVSLVASAAIAALGQWWGGLFGGWELLAQVFNFVVSFALVTAMFAFIYRFMPHVRLQWHDVWIGAVVTAFLFTVGKQAIGLYLGKSTVVSGFGAAGSLAVLLLWVYYSAQIFLMGAEFTRAYAHTFGSRQAHPPQENSPLATTNPYPAPVAASQTAAPRAPEQRLGPVAVRVQRHLMPAIGAAAALGALTAWGLAWRASSRATPTASRASPRSRAMHPLRFRSSSSV